MKSVKVSAVICIIWALITLTLAGFTEWRPGSGESFLLAFALGLVVGAYWLFHSTSDAQAGFILGILYGTAMLCTWLLAAIAQPIWQDVWLIHGIRVGTAAVTAYIVFVAAAHVYGVVNSEPL